MCRVTVAGTFGFSRRSLLGVGSAIAACCGCHPSVVWSLRPLGARGAGRSTIPGSSSLRTSPVLSSDGTGAALASLMSAAEIVDFGQREVWARRHCLRWQLDNLGSLSDLLRRGMRWARRSVFPAQSCNGVAFALCDFGHRASCSSSIRVRARSVPVDVRLFGGGVIGSASSASLVRQRFRLSADQHRKCSWASFVNWSLLEIGTRSKLRVAI